jgi:putative Mn2+ efflux pump MntP
MFRYAMPALGSSRRHIVGAPSTRWVFSLAARVKRLDETDQRHRSPDSHMLQTAVIAFSLSTDAFAASIAKGARYPGMSGWRTLGIALGFGVLEAIAPLIGYLLGVQFAGMIEAVDHWIAFGVLGLLGIRMLWKSLGPGEDEAPMMLPTWSAVIATAAGTSVDATAVGVSLAFASNNIPVTLIAIGLVTFGMTLIGLRLGGVIGTKVGRWAEFLGGLGLVAIGINILLTHLKA